jgi:NADH-quinone oxidoreductase subunit H
MEFFINLLSGFMPPQTATLVVQVVYGFILMVVPPSMLLVLPYAERKIVGRIQDRVGPNRAGPYGVLQGFADAIKMFTKEDITPTNADRVVFNLAPALSLISPLLVFAVVPITFGLIGTDLNIGILYVMAVGSFAMIAVFMAGWGSNNKYALLSSFRALAQLISYEIPLVLAIISVVLVTGSMSMVDIVRAQDVPFFVALPVAFITFLIASVAEGGRAPFDLLEAESEIVAGFHIEYSGMKFALFYLGEYIHIFAVALIGSTLFFGGWRGPFAEQVPILGIVYLCAKGALIVFIFFWLRGTFPRLRIDHMLDFAWKFLVPLGLVNVVVVAFVVKLVGANAGPPLLAAALLLANVILVAVTLVILILFARRSRSAALKKITAQS